MQEIKVNERYYGHKALFLGVLILILGIVVYSNFVAHKAIDPTLSITKELQSQPEYDSMIGNVHTSADTVTGFDVNNNGSNQISGGNQIIQTSGSLDSDISTIIESIDGNSDDDVLLYSRKIEELIAIKGQQTRMDMLIKMRKFMNQYSSDYPIYHTIGSMIQIIALGELAHKVEDCIQYNDSFVLNLFGVDTTIHSTLLYNSKSNTCTMTFAYADGSTHICSLGDTQKKKMKQVLIDKQGLRPKVNDQGFEAILEQFIKDKTCVETVIFTNQDTHSDSQIPLSGVSYQ